MGPDDLLPFQGRVVFYSKPWRSSDACPRPPSRFGPRRASSAAHGHTPSPLCLPVAESEASRKHPLHHAVSLAPWAGLFFQGINVFYGEIKCTIIKRGRGVFPQAHILSKGAVIWHPWLEYEIITQELTLGISDAPWDDCFYNLWRQPSVCIQVIT